LAGDLRKILAKVALFRSMETEHERKKVVVLQAFRDPDAIYLG
jgi:hypothetical protein